MLIILPGHDAAPVQQASPQDGDDQSRAAEHSGQEGQAARGGREVGPRGAGGVRVRVRPHAGRQRDPLPLQHAGVAAAPRGRRRGTAGEHADRAGVAFFFKTIVKEELKTLRNTNRNHTSVQNEAILVPKQ